MGLPLFRLLGSADGIFHPGKFVSEEPHDKCEGALHRRYEISEGYVILTYWRGELHEVIYQTPVDDVVGAAARNAMLFAHYGEGQVFREVLDNGFGKTYRRADMERYALWSYTMDYTTVGTMAFHEVKWR